MIMRGIFLRYQKTFEKLKTPVSTFIQMLKDNN